MLRLWARAPGRPYVVAHRGASGHAPENTFAAFDLALSMGADLIELDVHPSRDGELVVIHDHTLDRTTDGHGAVVEHDLAALRRLDAGSWKDVRFTGQRIPTLDEVLAWASGRVPIVIELKAGPLFYPGIEEHLLRRIRAHDALDACAVISFDHLSIKRLKALEPELATGILYAARLADGPAVARVSGADGLAPHVAFVSAEVVAEAHAAGIAVTVWEVDDERAMAALSNLDVDAITTNFPDRLARVLGATI